MGGQLPVICGGGIDVNQWRTEEMIGVIFTL
jgi:hypothetical protein